MLGFWVVASLVPPSIKLLIVEDRLDRLDIKDIKFHFLARDLD